jgi:hypothetical protein
MLDGYRDDDRRKLRALQLVDGDRVCQRILVRLPVVVYHQPLVESDGEFLFDGIDLLDGPDVAVEEFLLLVVLGLDDFVADLKALSESLRGRLAGANRFQRTLEHNVQLTNSDRFSVHRAQDLNVADRTEPNRIGSNRCPAGILSCTSVAAISSGISRSMKWKSERDSALPGSGIFPWRMRGAPVMILLAAACLNTSVMRRRLTSKAPDLSLRSRRAAAVLPWGPEGLPGPNPPSQVGPYRPLPGASRFPESTLRHPAKGERLWRNNPFPQHWTEPASADCFQPRNSLGLPGYAQSSRPRLLS